MPSISLFINRIKDKIDSSNKYSTIYFTLSSYISQIVNIIIGFISARLLGPEQLGIWNTYRTYKSYFNYGYVGTSDALNKEVSYLRGKDDHNAALDYTYNAFTFAMLNEIVLIVALFVFTSYLELGALEKFCMYAVVLIFTFEGITGFVNAFSKANNKFFVISFVNVSGAVLILIDIPAIIFFGLRGHIIANIIYSLVVAIFGYHLIGYKHKFKFDLQKIKRIVKLGFSMSLIGYAWIFFSTSDRLIIIRYLPSIDLGYYSLVNTMALPLTILIQNFNSVIFVELNKRYGKTNSINSILEYLDTLMKYQQRILPYIVGILIYILPIFIKLFLPKYIPGILPAQISAFGILVYAVSNSYQSILVTINKNKIIIISFFVIGILNLILCYIAVFMGFGISGTAFSMALSYILVSVILLYFSFKSNDYKNKHIFIKIWNLFKNVAVLIIAILVTEIIIHYILKYINVSSQLEDILNLIFFIILALIMATKPIKDLIITFNLLPKFFKKKNG